MLRTATVYVSLAVVLGAPVTTLPMPYTGPLDLLSVVLSCLGGAERYRACVHNPVWRALCGHSATSRLMINDTSNRANLLGLIFHVARPADLEDDVGLLISRKASYFPARVVRSCWWIRAGKSSSSSKY
ncbi:hypothetical protein CYLTODRAFT_427596 [Cylindrobasidium torrendii FP15055 ss-10]|uniref:F-box domain-containing protein n=1 Tax=Cylindrobasidium torrendii FP15055 ss-10 TaxID=1314674 RepID=A0A0D7ASY7_9AGAR|nr:hypothetical protein CYLTODRAFT_427639 [Cylindrobasidium torrendii FP15055 ss-10]KIY61322.1 hypothetical protein CYLTODRAFT_427596 [Cylindrobasidium torrendii FP15055 ss-10]